MSLKNSRELCAFFSTYLSGAEQEQDEETARSYAHGASAEQLQLVTAQARGLLDSRDLSLEELGMEANRWFADADEARAWLRLIFGALDVKRESSESSGPVVKDSNGAVLNEGDSVQVIKDLKVKGGSSDLKRGTLIKSIHLTGDSEAIECRVDGSTLVLKTCFLKKA